MQKIQIILCNFLDKNFLFCDTSYEANHCITGSVLLVQCFVFVRTYDSQRHKIFIIKKQYKKSTVMDLESLRTAELKEAFDEFDKVTILTLKSVPKI